MYSRDRVTPVGYQQIVGLVAATALTVPTGAQYALIVCTAQNVRWVDDGSTPTATLGMLLKTTDPALWYVGKLSRLKFIQAAATATLDVLYYG